MPRVILTALLTGLVTLLSGCAWVQMQPGAAQVRVYPLGQSMVACRSLGELATSITAQVGPYERNSLSVRDELETLARNEALTLHADSVQPLAEPANGRQQWQAYRCNGAR
ncbi:MAG TPA: DUF4156 domain-containing protein [Xanthomonadaceae bacterium]|nr:DUF4156 domain-containing protein [Xanthomonadaceae bacterium]